MKGDLHLNVDLGDMPGDEQERFRQAMVEMQKTMAEAVGRECEAFIAGEVRKRFNEVFMLGLACGVSLACLVVALGHWAS